jgi:hypothetical protein
MPLGPLAGFVATLLSASALYVIPVVGLPRADAPLLIGRLLAGNSDPALGLGYLIYFVIGILIAPLPILIWWPNLPGPPETFRGALVRGIIWGLVYWVLTTIVVAILGWSGPGAILVVLIAQLLWGIAFALTVAMSQGISPLETLGWEGYDKAMGLHDIGESRGTHTPGR